MADSERGGVSGVNGRRGDRDGARSKTGICLSHGHGREHREIAG